MSTTRREFVAGVGAAVAGPMAVQLPGQKASLSASKEDAGSEKPNILLIVSDQHSKYFLGSYGNQIVRTPNLDRMASEGMRFTNTYCPAPLCVPSRMSFMTGRTPSRNGVWHNNAMLGSGITTWPHVLSTAGYETSLIGRMHFTGPDQRHGFEQRPIGEFGAMHPGSRYVCSEPIRSPYYHGGAGQSRGAVARAGRGKTTYQYMDEQVAKAACGYLRERATSNQPFAAVAGFVLPHCPFIAPKNLFDHYYKKVDLPKVESEQPATIRRFRKQRGILAPPLTEKQVQVARAAYYGLCEYCDSLVGQLLECLEETGLAKDTLVVYSSDHGEMAGDHGCWWKSHYYEGSVGIPMIARLPGRIPADKVSDAVCNLMDLGPTFADIAGTRMADCDGRSLWPTLRGRHPKDWQDETYSEFCEVRGFLPSRMIRSGKWKLWVYDDREQLPPALFNLEDDPGELHDLAQEPRYSNVRDELLAKVYVGWQPRRIEQAAAQSARDFQHLKQWGQRVQPRNPDALEVPPPSYEKNVELL